MNVRYLILGGVIAIGLIVPVATSASNQVEKMKQEEIQLEEAQKQKIEEAEQLKAQQEAEEAEQLKAQQEAQRLKEEEEAKAADVLNQYDVIHTVANPADVTTLVDKTYKLDSSYVPADLRIINVAYSNSSSGASQTMLKEIAATAVETMFAAAKEQGLYLLARSGYRSYETQQTVYNNFVARDGQTRADTYSARPGHSEHQTGLAIDITSDSVNRQLIAAFGETPEGIWLNQNAHKYGFVMSYQQGKEHLTGYQYEPWHFRYVGVEVATQMYQNDWLLRDYATAVGALN